MSMLANEIFDAYFEALLRTPAVWDRYTTDALWTPEATRALVEVGLKDFPTGAPTAKGYRDRYGRSEYLTLDVCITDPNTWGPPLFVAEHENAPWKAKIEYCTWKLLSTTAERRVLVACFATKTDLPNVGSIERAVQTVCADNRGKDILLIAGDYDARPTNAAELRAAYTTRIVGSHP